MPKSDHVHVHYSILRLLLLVFSGLGRVTGSTFVRERYAEEVVVARKGNLIQSASTENTLVYHRPSANPAHSHSGLVCHDRVAHTAPRLSFPPRRTHSFTCDHDL
jgi:hypothetical protein